MFNEAFWFFYMVGVVDSLSFFSTFICIVGGVITLVAGGAWFFEEEQYAKRPFQIAWKVFAVAVLFTIALPSEDALYAGATM